MKADGATGEKSGIGWIQSFRSPLDRRNGVHDDTDFHEVAEVEAFDSFKPVIRIPQSW